MTQSTFSAQVANNLLTILQGYSKTIRLLLVMFLTLTVSTNAWGADYELVSFSDIKTNDVIIIVGTKSGTAYAMTNDGGTSNPPKPSKVTISNNKITTTATDIIFTVTKNNDGTLTFANGTNKLYCTATNNGVRVGTNANNKFSFDTSVDRLKNEATTRWLGIYNTQDWRCYNTKDASNIKDTKTTFYRKVTAAPSFTITATSNNNSYGTVSVSGTTITATPNAGYRVKSGDAGYTVTSGTAVVTNNGDNTFSVTPSSVCTITINFEAIPKYTVTLVPGSGSVTSTTLTEASAGAGVTLPTPTLDCGDWEFAGWATSAVSTETTTKPTLIAAGTYKPASNITLYAVYQRTKETEGNGGETEVTKSVSISTYATANNWSDATKYTSVTIDKNITATASSSGSNTGKYYNNGSNWRFYQNESPKLTISAATGCTIKTVKVTYSVSNTGVLTYNATNVTSGSATTINATLATFGVGNTGSATNGQVRITAIEVTYTTTSSSGTTTTTYYHSTPDCGGDDPEPTGYTITFKANGGTTIDKIENATALPNPLPETERAHYTFAGWFTDEDCTQAATAGAEINADITLYAKWTPITYTVTFNAGSGTYTSGDIQGNFATGLTLPTATPCDYASTNGWRFVGWSESTVSETTVRPAIHTGNYKPTKTITLHAVYAKTGTAQGAAGEFILSLQYEGTTYYVGQTFDNNKLSAETEQTNAARFTIEDNYLHYEGGYISHVSTSGSTNITRQANKEDAEAWTIADNGSTITFTSTADETRGLGFNYNDGSPRFAAYKLNEKEKDGETIKYPSTFTKTSVSGGNIQVTTYNSNPACKAPVDPKWEDATISHAAIQVVCGSKTLLGAADPNGPATISFSGTDLVNPVTVTASNGFFVSTDKGNDAGYKSEVTITPHKEGQNIGKLQNVYVIAQAPAQSGDFTGTITLTGVDITDGSQVINVTADVTCTTYTITWSVDGDTEMITPTTFYAGGEWELPENPTYECNGREFVGWTNTEIVQPQDIAPNVLYKEQGDFPTIESDITFYAVFAQEGTGDGSGTATVTDVLNRTTTGISNGAGYGNWSGKTAESSAVYAGRSAGGNDAIQLRITDSNEGIITTTSGGKARKVTVVWNTSTTSGRVLNIYGKNSAYSAVTELYGNNAGTLIGNIKYGTSTELIISDDYEYIGIRSNSGAMYLTSISIQWETDGEGDGNATTYTSYTTSCADVTAIRIVEPTTKTFNEGDKFVFDGKVLAINSDDSETDVTNSRLVHFDVDMNKVGTQTVTVSYLGFTATYEITINPVDKWQITWNVSGATDTGLGPKEVAKGTAIGKLPNPKAIPDGCDGKTFVGWTESNTVNSDGTEITFITSSTVPTQNTTYYAVFATSSGNAGDGNYVKLTETPADLSGEYLIVYEDSKGSPAAPKAFNGGLGTLDAASNTISVTIDGNTIKSTDATDAAKFTITKNGDAYIITSASNYHIGQTSDANGLLSSKSTSYTNTITITEGYADIIGSGNAHLRYNKTSLMNNGKETGLRFRYYKSDTYTGQQPIALYKKSGSSASYTDYTTGCHDVTITYYGFTRGYTTNCGGSELNVITQRVNSSHTIPTCTEITDPTTLGRTFLNLWKDQNGKEHKPGDSFIVTENITLYAQWALNTSEENTTLPTDVEDLATTDIIVTGGKTLTIPEGKTITINSLTLKGGLIGDGKSGNYAMPSVWVPEGATLVRKNTTINLDLVVNSKSWYPFAVPFAATINANVEYIHPTLAAASEYGTHFAIKTYDGARRAKEGVDQTNNWVQLKRNENLQPGVGYIISAMTYPDKDTATIRIPMTVPNEWLANGEQESITVKEQTTTRNAVAVTAYTGAAAEEHQRHAGWNFVANPYLSMFAGSNVANDVAYIKGSINIQNKYTYEDTEVTYVTIPAHDFSYYEQFKLSETKLTPEYSFFVQVGTDGTMIFETIGRQQAPASIAARNAEERPVKMDVDITLSDNHSSDLTGIIISDRYNDTYEIGRDLEKLFGSAYNLSVYTLMVDNTPLAYQALAIRSSMQVIPVGYRAPAQGEYTFRLNEATSSIDLLNEQYEQLVLVDYQTGALTNLLNSDYTFYSERTQSDNRFAIYAVPRQNASTDLPNAIGQDKEAQKIIHNGHLYILRNGNVYNGAGQIVK